MPAVKCAARQLAESPPYEPVLWLWSGCGEIDDGAGQTQRPHRLQRCLLPQGHVSQEEHLHASPSRAFFAFFFSFVFFLSLLGTSLSFFLCCAHRNEGRLVQHSGGLGERGKIEIHALAAHRLQTQHRLAEQLRIACKGQGCLGMNNYPEEPTSPSVTGRNTEQVGDQNANYNTTGRGGQHPKLIRICFCCNALGKRSDVAAGSTAPPADDSARVFMQEFQQHLAFK